MTGKERNEDELLKNCIQEAYGYSDEDILAELDEIEASLSDSDFPGAEERIFQKLMMRAAEEKELDDMFLEELDEREVASGKNDAEDNGVLELEAADVSSEVENVIESAVTEMDAEETMVVSKADIPQVKNAEFTIEEVKMPGTVAGSVAVAKSDGVEPETAATANAEKKVVRIGKKKMFVVAGLAAAFVAVMGGSVIGKNGYSFIERQREQDVVFNSGLNRSDVDDLETAYQKIQQRFGSVFHL